MKQLSLLLAVGSLLLGFGPQEKVYAFPLSIAQAQSPLSSQTQSTSGTGVQAEQQAQPQQDADLPSLRPLELQPALEGDDPVQAVSAIYQSLQQLYNGEDDSLADKFDHGYFLSGELLDLRNKAREKQARDEDLFFDYNYWIDAQDYQNLQIEKVVSLPAHQGKTKVLVCLDLFEGNPGGKSNIIVDIVKENGQWRVDDFSSQYQVSLKNDIKEFLNNRVVTPKSLVDSDRFIAYNSYTTMTYDYSTDLENPYTEELGYELNIKWSDDYSKALEISLYNQTTDETWCYGRDVPVRIGETGEWILKFENMVSEENAVIYLYNDCANVFNVFPNYVLLQADVLKRVYECDVPIKPNIVECFTAVAPYIHPSNGLMYDAKKVLYGTMEPEDKIIDLRNCFLSFDFKSDEDQKRHLEACFWRMQNGKKLVAVSYSFPPDENFCRFFIIDPKEKTLYRVNRPFNTPDDSGEYRFLMYQLPRQGKTIQLLAFPNGVPETYSYSFDGVRFIKQKKVAGADQ